MTEADRPSADEVPTPRPKREMTEKQKAVLAAARIKAIEVRRENAELRAKEKEVERREKAATLAARKRRVADALGGGAGEGGVATFGTLFCSVHHGAVTVWTSKD